jgi:hypothetical protein
MSRETLAQLTHASIGRTRIVGRNRLGMPLEETIPAIQGVYQYDKDGNRLHTNTSCHRANVKHLEQHVKARVLADLLVEGFLEEGKCPYQPREALDGMPAVPPPVGFNAYCDGRGALQADGIGGCAHLREVVKGRRALAKEKAQLRKPPSARQQDMNAVVVAVMAAMKGESQASPDEAMIRAAVEKVLNSTAPAPVTVTPTVAMENPAAAAGKEALKAARQRTATTTGEPG